MGTPFESTIYGGEIELRRGGNHVYRMREKGGKSYPVPNCTTILGMKDKTRMLLPWQARVCAFVAVEHVKPILDLLPQGDMKFSLTDKARQNIRLGLQELGPKVLNASNAVRDSAGDIGTQVHQYIEDFFTAKLSRKARAPGVAGLDIEVKRAVQFFAAWAKRNEVRPIAMERAVFSREHFYTGQLDLILEVGGETGVWDAKTGKGVYPEVMLQMAAYRQAYNEEMKYLSEPPLAGRNGVLLFTREERSPVDKFLTGDFEAIILPATHKRDFETFKALQTVYKFDKAANKDLREARGE